jgi:hypothetical protein
MGLKGRKRMRTERKKRAFKRFCLVFPLVGILTALGCGTASLQGYSDFGQREAHGWPRFSQRDREQVRDYFDRHRFDPSLGQPSDVAPGLAKQIEETGVLPTDLKAIPLPEKLEKKLSPLSPPYARFIVGSDVVLMNVQTREVQDVVKDVFR